MRKWKTERTKYLLNHVMRRQYGAGKLEGYAADIIAERTLEKRHDKHQQHCLYCLQCQLLLNRPIIISSRAMLRAHLNDHRIMRALGLEMEWATEHTSPQVGLWSQRGYNK